MTRRSGFSAFLAGTLMATIAIGVIGTAVVLQHPHLMSRIKSHLPSLGDLTGPGPTQPVDLSAVLVRCAVDGPGTAISPLIYGVALAYAPDLQALGATVDRWGGNPSSRYNWVIGHAWNASRDWEFRNVNYTGGQGSTADNFVAQALAANVQPLLTVPTLGWVARNTDNDTRSVGVPDQGGAARAPGSAAIPGYDPTANQRLTSVPSLARKPGPFSDPPDPKALAVYQDEWVHHLMDQFGAAPRGVSYYAMDNEPDLWSYTHTDVHPVQMSYDDMLRNFEDYATAVKAQDPRALILGPDLSGWTAYWYSALDRGSDNFGTHADRSAHGGQPFIAWWLNQVAAHDRATGQRSLDVLDVHYYPQADGVDSKAADSATQALRIRSVRSLYDPNYVDESWISQPVMLIPRLRAWINQYYPGTKLAITEYRWGGDKDASGAVALAEVLGIFGREGVDLATYWQYPDPATPAGAAFRIYRNFDGKGGTFGDRSLPCTSSATPIRVFGSRHSDTGEIDLVLVNESPNVTSTVRVDLGQLAPKAVDRFQILAGSGNISGPQPAAVGGLDLPGYSVTLLRLKGA